MRATAFTHTDTLSEPIRALAHTIGRDDPLDPLIEAIGDARIVLLGEASHGTHEYYTRRAAISKRLIEEKGFNFIAVEGDWPDCYEVNRYIKGWRNSGEHAYGVLHDFDRWPTWMWANWEIVALAEWLKRHNAEMPEERKVGFYGLDMYSLWESLDALMSHLRQFHPESLEDALKAVTCFEPFNREGQTYGWFTRLASQDCENEVVDLLTSLRTRPLKHADDPESHFNAEQNAHVAVGAERYYRTMMRADNESWNVRDTHMADTLGRLLEHHGEVGARSAERGTGKSSVSGRLLKGEGQSSIRNLQSKMSKAIVWEHNTHVGDARYTDMAGSGMVNVGQLARERHGEDSVFIVGFGCYEGSVVAGRQWGAPMEKMPVPAAREGSWERTIHDAQPSDQLLISQDFQDIDGFMSPNGHRAIGVVYDPSYERYGNYVPTYLTRRYDAFVYLEHAHALHPLHVSEHFSGEAPETYPWGV